MRNILKAEWRRCFTGKFLGVALLLGCLIVISHVVMYVYPDAVLMDNYLLGTGEYPLSVFNKWIGGEGHSFQSTLYMLVLPLLATIPYASTCFTDKKTGYTKNIFTRTPKKYYYLSKLIVVYLSGGIVVTIPLVFSLYLTALRFPSLIPESSSMTFPLFENSMWSDLFYTHPYYYVFAYLIVIFLFSGLLAIIPLTVGFFVNNKYVLVLVPFMGYVLVDFILDYLDYPKYSPRAFLRPDQPAGADLGVIIFEYCALLLVVIGVYVYKVRKDETY